jgi:hypothetical protein
MSRVAVILAYPLGDGKADQSMDDAIPGRRAPRRGMQHQCRIVRVDPSGTQR